MLIDAIHNALDRRPAAERPRVVLFGESLGAWTSQDAFAHRGTQGLVDARVDRAIWIGTPYMSRWSREVLHDDRPDTDRSLVGRFNDFGELEALGPEARRRLRYAANVIPGQFEAKGHDYRADLARFVREVYALPASDDQLAAVEQALRASELERKRLLDAAKAAATDTTAGDGQAGGSGSSSSNATSRS